LLVALLVGLLSGKRITVMMTSWFGGFFIGGCLPILPETFNPD
jgi:hypothetical protein